VQFESTLASVLQNRPADCEVLVVQPRAYDDPYDLRAEVRFVQAPPGSSTIDLLNLGIASATGAIVHVLSCDAEVIDGWTEPVLARFDDPTLGCVSPLVVAADGGWVVARGVRYGKGGRRKVRAKAHWRRRARAHCVTGPTLAAGFYRRDAVLDAGGFCREVGDELADVDLALALQRIGWRAEHEEDSVVSLRVAPTSQELSWRRGRQAERLFWRNASATGWAFALVLHASALTWEMLSNFWRPALVPHLVGRLLGVCELARHLRRSRQLSAARQTGERSAQEILAFTRASESEGPERWHPRAAA